MNYWFKRKKYGWGWTPATWQGWLSTALYILAVFGSILILPPDKTGALPFFVTLIGSTILLLVVCFWKGEPPKWSWGDD